MDSNDIERERGITILSKNTAVYYKDTKINIIDTPGHADFGGEVERVLKMVNGVVLVVDCLLYTSHLFITPFLFSHTFQNYPMGDSRYSLSFIETDCRKQGSCRYKKNPSPNARLDIWQYQRTKYQGLSLIHILMDLDASDEQLDCPFIYASARAGFARYELEDTNNDMAPLFETIIKHIPAPEGDPEAPTQVLISTIDYNEFVGRIGVGKIDNGSLRINQECVLVNHHDPDKFKKIKRCV